MKNRLFKAVLLEVCNAGFSRGTCAKFYVAIPGVFLEYFLKVFLQEFEKESTKRYWKILEIKKKSSRQLWISFKRNAEFLISEWYHWKKFWRNPCMIFRDNPRRDCRKTQERNSWESLWKFSMYSHWISYWKNPWKTFKMQFIEDFLK